MGETFVNFAYGSNMCTQRLRARTPSAQPLCIGRLDGHRLMWHKVGRDGSAKCDIRQTGASDDVVWGVLFRITIADKPVLDAAEGLGDGYESKSVAIRTRTGIVQALSYQATHVDATLRPFDWYRAFVVAGADEHGLPAAYRRLLLLQPALDDPDGERRALNLALLHNAAVPAPVPTGKRLRR
jgi:hypothetical protein